MKVAHKTKENLNFEEGSFEPLLTQSMYLLDLTKTYEGKNLHMNPVCPTVFFFWGGGGSDTDFAATGPSDISCRPFPHSKPQNERAQYLA